MTIQVKATSTATTDRITDYKRRLFVTLVFDTSNAVIAAMTSIGAGIAVRRTKQLRRSLTAKMGYTPRVRVERYESLEHDFYLRRDELRVGKPKDQRQRDRDYWKAMREAKRILSGV